MLKRKKYKIPMNPELRLAEIQVELEIINEFSTIFDMETRKWVKREKYVNMIIKNHE